MSLRTKLFIGIGSLFLVLTIISFVFPRFFIEKDVAKVRSYFDDEMEVQNKKARTIWQNVFNEQLNLSIDIINSTLEYFSDSLELKSFVIQSLKEAKNVSDNTLSQDPIIKKINYKKTVTEKTKSYNFLKGSVKEKSIQLAYKLSQDLNIELFQAAAIVGNFLAEGFAKGLPNIIEGGKEGPPPSWGKQNIGYGWAQWTNTSGNENKENDRLNVFISRLGGGPEKEAKEALDSDNYSYVLYEFLEDYYFNKVLLKLRKSKNLEEATSIIYKQYIIFKEKSSHPRVQARFTFAKKIFKDLSEVEEEAVLGKIKKSLAYSDNDESNEFQTLSLNTSLKQKNEFSTDYVIALESSLSGELFSNLFQKMAFELSKKNNKNYMNDFIVELIKKCPQVDYIQVSQGGSGFSFANSTSNHEGLFFLRPLFDDKAYFKENSNGNAVPNNLGLVESKFLKKNYISNTIEIKEEDQEPIYFTLGRGFFEDVTGSLLLNKAVIVILSPTGSLLHAVDDKHNTLTKTNFMGFPFEEIIKKDSGHLTWKQKDLSYFQIISSIKLPVKTYVLIPDSEDPLYQMKNVVNSNMVSVYEMLSSQLMTLGLFLLGIALVYLGYFSKRITKPITLLAEATKKIGKGDFEEITLPLVKDSEAEISVLTKGFGDMIGSLQEREKIRDLLDKVVSKEIAQEILKGNVQLGGESKIVTILFADIRDFTSMTKDMDPQLVLKGLNKYVTLMTEVIEKEGGVIDKYIGDAIMALYGAPIADKEGPRHAIESAILMIERLKKENLERIKRGEKEIFIGIGIHTGKVVAGNMGTMNRLNYTVLGAGVNLASRLCSSASPMEIRISQDTLDASGMKENLIVEPLEPKVYKGFKDPIVTYAVKGFK